MTVYSYKCSNCGLVDSTIRGNSILCICGDVARRIWRVNQQPQFTPHFNYSVGNYVRTQRDFELQLKIKAEHNSIRTGILHEYSPTVPGDIPEPTTHTLILEDQMRTHVDRRLIPNYLSRKVFTV